MSRKYLELFKEGFPSDIDVKTSIENKPYVGYSVTLGLAYTVVPKPVAGPADNEIWYTTVDGSLLPPPEEYSYGELDDFSLFGAYIISNTYENGLGVIKFDRDITVIGATGFKEIYSLASIILPDSVTSIGELAFYKCTSLTSIVIPDSVTSIGEWAIRGCTSLTTVTIPNSVTSIEWAAFAGLTSLTTVTIPNSVTNIGIYAFGGCTSLTSITIPNSVTEIEDRAFASCSGLTSIIYEGTQEQWNAITKGTDWNSNTPATYVQCSDGQVEL